MPGTTSGLPDTASAGADAGALASGGAGPSPTDVVVAFDKICEGCIFVLSGFNNPLRNEIRTMAIAMGATYAKEWEKGRTTHLVSAFAGTPKYIEAINNGGVVVGSEWVTEQHSSRIKLPVDRYVPSLLYVRWSLCWLEDVVGSRGGRYVPSLLCVGSRMLSDPA